MKHSCPDEKNTSLDIASGLVIPSACFSHGESLAMETATYLAETNHLPLVMLFGPTTSVILLLSIGLSVVWSRGKGAVLSSLIGCGLCLVTIQRFPGSYPWPGTSTNLYGSGPSFYWALIIALPIAFGVLRMICRKVTSDKTTAWMATTLYLAALCFAFLHHSTKPLLESDYPFSRHLALVVLGVLGLLAFPIYRFEESHFGESE